MDNRKLMLMLVAVLAVGIFALPSTVAMFGGQHNWYDLEPSGNDVPCEKCHADVFDELYNNVGPHDEMECWYCHRTSNLTGYTYASGDGTTSVPGEEAHAASTVECMACHEGLASACADCHFGITSKHPVEWEDFSRCGDCHASYTGDGGGSVHGGAGILKAGGFGLTIDTTNDTGTNAAHMDFVLGSKDENSTLMEGTNEACITCHTHTAIDINWTHAYKMSLDARQTSAGVWELSNFKTEGSYNVTTYGNMSGETTGVTEPEVKWDNGTTVSNP
ncbi:MAG: hypothetical protein SVY15_09125 [Halobacteriota archaeon]|nr:hypothetical protein [Halobacteriota archaeon]